MFNMYQEAFGHKINFDKSEIKFNKPVNDEGK